MTPSDPVLLLKELIASKEAEHAMQETIVREQLLVTYETLKPINLLKSTIAQAVQSPEIRSNVANAILGRAAGFAVKHLIQLGTRNPLVKISASIAEMIVAGQVTQNAEEIKTIGAMVLSKIFNHHGPTEVK